jgi:hypothetical protein
MLLSAPSLVCHTPALPHDLGNMIIKTHLGFRLPFYGSGAPADGFVTSHGQGCAAHKLAARADGSSAASDIAFSEPPSSHLQMTETCKLLRLGYHKASAHRVSTRTSSSRASKHHIANRFAWKWAPTLSVHQPWCHGSLTHVCVVHV